MPFWPFKKKEQPVEFAAVAMPQAVDSKEKLESDIRLVVENFYEITRMISRIEHNAKIGGFERDKMDQLLKEAGDMLKSLVQREPQFTMYWNNLFDSMHDCVFEAKKFLPTSPYEAYIENRNLESISRASRSNSSEFLQTFEELKKKLASVYKHEFNVQWPHRSGLKG
ncbi:MAG TPA: hypothetical protein HA282_03870 [Nanoarchaeota archaeon]|nr:hypothetical protein [Candidatus Pacearchaeota archaeon]HIH18052.1 hypothetical protein [Nanoarchaeota archaeon]HIH34748.1 hypothetical protein [Nanoarchaeota archaeon]HIH51351.1 hypothetical protein [Nanoarchaeota archaeon]HIH66328.1 hypothetical protein [Nanoarchaeota archaeon]